MSGYWNGLILVGFLIAVGIYVWLMLTWGVSPKRSVYKIPKVTTFAMRPSTRELRIRFRIKVKRAKRKQRIMVVFRKVLDVIFPS